MLLIFAEDFYQFLALRHERVFFERWDGAIECELLPSVVALRRGREHFDGALRGLRLGLDVNNVLDDEVLLFGNVGFGTPQFFPTATRHAFFSARYTLR